MFPEVSVAVQVKVVVPIIKKEPEAIEHANVTPGALSETVGSG